MWQVTETPKLRVLWSIYAAVLLCCQEQINQEENPARSIAEAREHDNGHYVTPTVVIEWGKGVAV